MTEGTLEPAEPVVAVAEPVVVAKVVAVAAGSTSLRKIHIHVLRSTHQHLHPQRCRYLVRDVTPSRRVVLIPQTRRRTCNTTPRNLRPLHMICLV